MNRRFKKLKSFSVHQALAIELGKIGSPVVLRYDMARIAWHLYKVRAYEGHPLAIKLDDLDMRAFSRIEKTLRNNGLLKSFPDIYYQGGYCLIGGNLNDHNSVICSIDKFCYLSHLSAMEFHGLTDRLPEKIYVSTPANDEWKTLANKRMEKDFGEEWGAYSCSGLPQLGRTTVTKIGRRSLNRYSRALCGRVSDKLIFVIV
jgi:hypothetical protein